MYKHNKKAAWKVGYVQVSVLRGKTKENFS
jgi:hypothetical protein